MMEDLITITQEEYRALQFGKKALKCRLDIPRKWYEDKLNSYLAQENKTRTTYNLISLYKARLRYYDLHIDEANNLAAFKRDCMILRQWKKVFKEHKSMKLWKDCVIIEKQVKENGIESWNLVQHALEVIHEHFKKEI